MRDDFGRATLGLQIAAADEDLGVRFSLGSRVPLGPRITQFERALNERLDKRRFRIRIGIARLEARGTEARCETALLCSVAACDMRVVAEVFAEGQMAKLLRPSDFA